MTGLRGVAAGWVVIYHLYANPTVLSLSKTAINHGYLAVDLFFVLSGFVLALTHGQDERSFQSYRRFLALRLARVYPLFIAVTALALLLFPERFGSFWILITNATLTQAWGWSESIVTPAWSISTEFAAYLIFPILSAFILRESRFSLRFTGLIVLLIYTVLAWLPGPVLGQASRNGPLDIFGSYTLFPLLRCTAGFAAGLLAFRWFAEARATPSADVLMPLALAAVCLQGLDVFVLPMIAIIIVALARGKSTSAVILGCGPLRWLGQVSYSVYLLHPLVNGAVHEPVRRMLDTWNIPRAESVTRLALLVLIVACSAIMFYLIERPCRTWVRRRLADQRGLPFRTSAHNSTATS